MRSILTALVIVFILVGVTYDKKETVKAKANSGIGVLQSDDWRIQFHTISKEDKQYTDVFTQGNDGSNQVVEGRAGGEVKSSKVKQTARISWYGFESCTNPRCLQANGTPLVEADDGMACSFQFRLGDRINIIYGENKIVLTCTDRGGFEGLGRTFDLHKWNFERLEILSKGVIEVEYEIL